MICYKCSTDNSERRSFCKKCGVLIVNFCSNCGFHNDLNDRYCGGCGTNISEAKRSGTNSALSQQENISRGKYSSDEMNELISTTSQKGAVKPRAKDIRGDDEISQNVIDNIFEAGNEGKNNKEK
ncbi:MAG: zinc ribbon domain-containing protein [Nitrospiraceae bacterium]|nr:zinc ribbon domain-containing protein [Nitrospiraceae bacterium]